MNKSPACSIKESCEETYGVAVFTLLHVRVWPLNDKQKRLSIGDTSVDIDEAGCKHLAKLLMENSQ